MNERAEERWWIAAAGRPAAAGRGRADFEALFHEHHAGLFRLLFRMLGSGAEAEDVVQEAFLKLYQQSADAPRIPNVRAWLYRVGANLALNSRRAEARRTGREARSAAEVGTGPEDPAEATARRSERQAVRQALEGLPERQRQLLLLRHSGLSYRELAELLGVAPTSIGTLLARAEAAFAAVYRAGEGPGKELDPHAL